MKRATAGALVVALAASLAVHDVGHAATWESVVDSNSFGSYSALESEWRYRYPWGSDHNGTARMYASPSDHNHVSLSGGVLTLKASRISWDEGYATAGWDVSEYRHP